ncbi:uncharacterized protein LOC125942417 [Dermacentor silvarum]|uniref:uncharacterized protein LOC125942417 n=1 Tax=Dermacentor silvarum TaxID=543639 RepID=UPI002100CC7C|nr:uncharacterized protein LOC125942417 [Dermacentor silvarum]
MDDVRRQPSGSCTVRSSLDNLRPAFSVSHQFQDFQSGCFGPEWDGFDSFVEDICDCYRQKHGRKEAMTIVMGACGSQLTDSLEEMLLDPVVPASNKRPVQEYRPVSSLEYCTDVSGVRPRVALRCTLLVSSEEAIGCVMETDAEPVASVFQGALQLDPLCIKASNQYLVVLFIPGELAEAVLLPRFSYPLSSDPTQMQREPWQLDDELVDLAELEHHGGDANCCATVVEAPKVVLQQNLGVRNARASVSGVSVTWVHGPLELWPHSTPQTALNLPAFTS